MSHAPDRDIRGLSGKQLHKGTGDVLRDLEYAETITDGDGIPGGRGKLFDFANRAIRVAQGEIRQLREQKARSTEELTAIARMLRDAGVPCQVVREGVEVLIDAWKAARADAASRTRIDRPDEGEW